MRIQRLDLIRYGKFTDEVLTFPPAPRDFHLIVGPNEAGKSTVRAAIQDLLFGIHTRSPLAFVHPLNELRLGAAIEHDGRTLEFQRIKAQRQTLRAADDAVLADTALAAFLGTADRVFFDQMFGLDHGRLIAGGNSILNAEDNIGQILFQSAAGIAGLGRVRDALSAEADQLWAPRKSGERDYYIAAQKLEAATAALKEATVRTKVWNDAHLQVGELEQALAGAMASYQQLQTRRDRLERIRRTAPFRGALQALAQQQAALGTVISLPADATSLHAVAQRELAGARQLLALRQAECDEATQAMREIVRDAAVLAHAEEIVALDEKRLQYSAHARDIERRQGEMAALWGELRHAATQLGWPLPALVSASAEDALQQRLPTVLARRTLGQRMRDYSGLLQSRQAAREASQARLLEVEQLQARLNALPAAQVPSALRAALSAARALGDPIATQQRQAALVARADAQQQAALRALAPWPMTPVALLALAPPSPATLQRLLQDRQRLLADVRAAGVRHAEAQSEIAAISLELSQFMATHDPTTQEAVLQARQVRDAAWSALRTGSVGMEAAAPGFEQRLAHADALADSRVATLEDATQLSALRQRLERRRLAAETAAATLQACQGRLDDSEAAWSATAAALGLAGMQPEEMADWLGARQQAIDAGFALQEAQAASAATADTIAAAAAALAAALRAAGLEMPAADAVPSLATLCLHAEETIAAADSAAVAQRLLTAQLQTAQAAAAALSLQVAQAESGLQEWSVAWSAGLARAGLAADSEVAAVEGSFELFADIEQKLAEIRVIRVERIDAMRADLQHFDEQAQRLAEGLEPDLRNADGAAIAQLLSARLQVARQAEAHLQRLQAAQQQARLQMDAAQEAIRSATASLAPLMARTGAQSDEALAECILRSDLSRQLQEQAMQAQAALLHGGDGLDRQQIEAEVDGATLTETAGELAVVSELLSAAVAAQASLSARLADAQRTLAEFQGAATAAEAESRRQEALAQMADAAERFVKVHTAARLLRWAIERYREQKQGPMLARASAIFAQLTLGSFDRLIVDFDKRPMTLEGQRGDGRRVGVAGMSEGTRDQLYLALRLAALELHLQQVPPLPFIADDLFINYDDARSQAGLEALATLSQQTQVIFLTHHDHLSESVRAVFGERVNIVRLRRSAVQRVQNAY